MWYLRLLKGKNKSSHSYSQTYGCLNLILVSLNWIVSFGSFPVIDPSTYCVGAAAADWLFLFSANSQYSTDVFLNLNDMQMQNMTHMQTTWIEQKEHVVSACLHHRQLLVHHDYHCEFGVFLIAFLFWAILHLCVIQVSDVEEAQNQNDKKSVGVWIEWVRTFLDTYYVGLCHHNKKSRIVLQCRKASGNLDMCKTVLHRFQGWQEWSMQVAHDHVSSCPLVFMCNRVTIVSSYCNHLGSNAKHASDLNFTSQWCLGFYNVCSLIRSGK